MMSFDATDPNQHRSREIEKIQNYFETQIKAHNLNAGRYKCYARTLTLVEGAFVLCVAVLTALTAVLTSQDIDKQALIALQAVGSVIAAIVLSTKGYKVKVDKQVTKYLKLENMAQLAQSRISAKIGYALEDSIISGSEYSMIIAEKNNYINNLTGDFSSP